MALEVEMRPCIAPPEPRCHQLEDAPNRFAPRLEDGRLLPAAYIEGGGA